MAHSLRYLIILFASSTVWAVLSVAGLIDGLKEEALRWRYIVRGEIPSEVPVTFVDLDAPTVSMVGDKPWDRRLFGVALHALLGPGQARAVGVDFILSRFGTSGLLDSAKAREGDEFLGRVIERYSDRIVLAGAYTGVFEDYDQEYSKLRLIRDGHVDPELNPYPEAPTFPILKWRTGRLGLADVDEKLNSSVIPSWVPAFVEVEGPRYSLHLLDGMRRYWLAVTPTVEVAVEGEAFVLGDGDGFEIARLPKHSEQRLLTLGLELYLAAQGLDGASVERSADFLTIRDPSGRIEKQVPLHGGQSLEANWFNRWANPELEQHVSMGEVLQQADELAKASEAGDTDRLARVEAWFGQFKDAVILVGPADPALKDVAPTPFNRYPVPKVGLHANVFRTVSEDAYIRRLSPIGDVLVLFALTFLIGILALWNGRGRIAARVSALALLGLYIAGVYWAFSTFHLVVPLVAPTASVGTAVLLGALVKLSAEELQRRRIRSLFGTYVSPELVDHMVESTEAPRLGGVEAEITALFSDVVGFSSFSEELVPERLVALMNEYLSEMTEIIQDEGGTLDKYVGDAIIAMFGMPVRLEDHALRACRAAVRMQQCHADLRRKWQQSGEWPDQVLEMRTRIGLNSGVAVIGNMGSNVRFNYTMMGDSVNLAARCEPIGKAYGVQTVAAEATIRALGADPGGIRWRRLDRVAVKGRGQPVDLYELLDGSVEPDRFEALRGAYEGAFAHYLKGDWSAASSGFEASGKLELASPDGLNPSIVLGSRCRSFSSLGAPRDWDGVHRMESKDG